MARDPHQDVLVNYAPRRQARNRPRRRILAQSAVTTRTSSPRIRKARGWSQLTNRRTMFTRRSCRRGAAAAYCFRRTSVSRGLSEAL
jgi:hypothetical protein